MSYTDPAVKLAHWGIGAYAIKSALRDRGYFRLLSRAKSPPSEQNMRKRLDWVRPRLDWGYEDWRSILWSDETWVAEGRHRDIFVTRKPCDELEETCLVDKTKKRPLGRSGDPFQGDKMVLASSGKKMVINNGTKVL
ncbi:hypothetical protein K3495_g13096 [Podosphaera aphanis]|nr:hypothetical protein K3495_g13096 [Podosphaera aphanis]